MPNTSAQEDIFEQIDTILEEIQEQVDQAQSDTSSEDQYERIKYMMQIIENDRHKEVIRKVLDQIHSFSKGNYAVDKHIGLIINYELVGANFDEVFVQSFLKRFRKLVRKEIRYLKMQAPKNDFFHGVCDTAQASIANLIPARGTLNDQQKYTNVLLKLIMDYRYFTLNDETAWDFAAQSILSETRTIQ